MFRTGTCGSKMNKRVICDAKAWPPCVLRSFFGFPAVHRSIAFQRGALCVLHSISTLSYIIRKPPSSIVSDNQSVTGLCVQWAHMRHLVFWTHLPPVRELTTACVVHIDTFLRHKQSLKRVHSTFVILSHSMLFKCASTDKRFFFFF